MKHEDQLKNYIKKPQPVKAKLFERGDEDGFVQGGTVPYINGGIGRNAKEYAEFGTHYVVIDNDLHAKLIPIEQFEQDYECLDY